MKIKTAKSAGFCFGVKRAMELAREQQASGKRVYTYGPLIHNEEAVNLLAKQGVCVVNWRARGSRWWTPPVHL